MSSAFQVDYVASSVFFFSYVLSALMLWSSMHFGVRTQPSQFLFYLAAVICGGVTLRSAYLRKNHPEDYLNHPEHYYEENFDEDKIDKVKFVEVLISEGEGLKCAGM